VANWRFRPEVATGGCPLQGSAIFAYNLPFLALQSVRFLKSVAASTSRVRRFQLGLCPSANPCISIFDLSAQTQPQIEHGALSRASSHGRMPTGADA
jgi:hypothetical protein